MQTKTKRAPTSATMPVEFEIVHTVQDEIPLESTGRSVGKWLDDFIADATEAGDQIGTLKLDLRELTATLVKHVEAEKRRN